MGSPGSRANSPPPTTPADAVARAGPSKVRLHQQPMSAALHSRPDLQEIQMRPSVHPIRFLAAAALAVAVLGRSEEHTSALPSLMRISSAVFCLKNKQNTLPTP